MKLTFLGTRGYIAARTRRHSRHSALLVSYRARKIMIDCGEDWRGRLSAVDPNAIFLTHAHPDHAWGLQDGAPCPVYASAKTWRAIGDFPIERRMTVRPRKPVKAHGMAFEAFPLIHSFRAPAVGYRISAGGAAVFYAPDVVDIIDRNAALDGVACYIGDGSTMTRSMVRRRGDRLFGHTTMRAQLGWCADAGVERAIFTHCGAGVVEGDERTLGAKLRKMGRARGVEARIAHDGLEVVLR